MYYDCGTFRNASHTQVAIARANWIEAGRPEPQSGRGRENVMKPWTAFRRAVLITLYCLVETKETRTSKGNVEMAFATYSDGAFFT
jgi:hypothetical protein